MTVRVTKYLPTYQILHRRAYLYLHARLISASIYRRCHSRSRQRRTAHPACHPPLGLRPSLDLSEHPPRSDRPTDRPTNSRSCPSHSPDANLLHIITRPSLSSSVYPAQPAQLKAQDCSAAQPATQPSIQVTGKLSIQIHARAFPAARPVSLRFVPSRLVSSRLDFSRRRRRRRLQGRPSSQDELLLTLTFPFSCPAPTHPPSCPLPAPRADDAYQVDSRPSGRLIVSFACPVCLASNPSLRPPS